MRLQLQICEDYAREYRIVFNATKSATMFIARRKVRIYDDLQFLIDGKRIPTVEELPHLGHIVTSTLDKKSDILAKRNSLCGKINNVLCYFTKCDPFVKLKLVRSYCSDFYGSVLWEMSHNTIESICVAWRKGLRRTLSLPYCTHSPLVAAICDFLPLRDELVCRCASFISKCLLSDNGVVRA